MTWNAINYTKSIKDGHTIVQLEDDTILPDTGQRILATVEIQEGVKPKRIIKEMVLGENYWTEIYNICAWMPYSEGNYSPYLGTCGYSVIDEICFYNQQFQNKKKEYTPKKPEEHVNKTVTHYFPPHTIKDIRGMLDEYVEKDREKEKEREYLYRKVHKLQKKIDVLKEKQDESK